MAMETKNNPPGPFSPYVKTINMDDPLMKRVPFPMMDIGASSIGMPDGLRSRPDNIEHVGSGVGKAR